MTFNDFWESIATHPEQSLAPDALARHRDAMESVWKIATKAESVRIARTVRSEAKRLKGFTLYHPEHDLAALADRIVKESVP